MTGPLAQQFATLRAAVSTMYLGHPDDEALAALSAIERHVQDMEGRWQEMTRPFDKSEYDAMYERMRQAEAARDSAAHALHQVKLLAPAIYDEAIARAALPVSGAPHGQEHGPQKEEE